MCRSSECPKTHFSFPAALWLLLWAPCMWSYKKPAGDHEGVKPQYFVHFRILWPSECLILKETSSLVRRSFWRTDAETEEGWRPVAGCLLVRRERSWVVFFLFHCLPSGHFLNLEWVLTSVIPVPWVVLDKKGGRHWNIWSFSKLSQANQLPHPLINMSFKNLRQPHG